MRQWSLSDLRSQINIVSQENFLFSQSVANNIAFGKYGLKADIANPDDDIARTETGLTDEMRYITYMARVAQTDDFVRELEDGYDTVVGERGTGLSAGQCQLISFARVLLSNPRILVLDEATSHVDTVTEAALQSGLRALLKGRTSFIIAHRLSTIEHADLICYIDKGRIVESGTHSQLLSSGGYYANLYESQFE